MILYMPTLALVNSVSFNQMKDPRKSSTLEFGTMVGLLQVCLSVISFIGILLKE
jgi:hypothetical protein